MAPRLRVLTFAQCAHLYGKPRDLGSPAFDVLVRRASYEVRTHTFAPRLLEARAPLAGAVGRKCGLASPSFCSFADIKILRLSFRGGVIA